MDFTRGPRAAPVVLSTAVSTALAAALLIGIGTALAQTIPPQPPPTVAPAPPQPANQFSPNELVDAGHRFFGGVSRGLAMIVEKAVSQWGLPNG